MDFRFGCASALYRKGVHPRLLCTQADLDELSGRVRSGAGRKIMDGLRRRVRPLTARVLAGDDLPGHVAQWNNGWTQYATNIMFGLHDMAMVGVLDDCEETLTAVRRVLQALPEGCDRSTRGRQGFGWGFPLEIGWAYDLAWHRIPEEERRRFAEWGAGYLVRETMGFVAPHYYKTAGGNGTLGYGVVALAAALTLAGDPGVPPLQQEIERCVSWLEATLHVAIGPDGYPEEDVGYGTGVVGAYLSGPVEMVRRAGLYDAHAECPRYGRFGRAVLHFVQPWGTHLSNTGDHGDDFGGREFVLARLAAETRDPVLLWLLGSLCYPSVHKPDDAFRIEVPLRKGMNVPASAYALLALDDLKPRPRHPARAGVPTAFKDDARGLVTFRSGWRDDDALVVFDGSQRSPAAQGHFHDSCGHFSFSALGEYFAIDTGRYSIEQNCHNVVLIDGKSGRDTGGQWRQSFYHGRLIAFQPGDFVDFAAVDSSHQHNCYWARRYLGLVKGTRAASGTAHGAPPAYAWTVDDVNKENAWAEFWWQLQTCPENVIRIGKGKATVTGWRRGNHMDVHWVLPAPEDYPQPHVLQEVVQDEAVPSSYKYVKDPYKLGGFDSHAAGLARPALMVHHAVYVRPRLTAKIGGLNGRFLSLMIPRRRGERPAAVRRLPSLPNSLAVRLTFAHVEDVLIFAFEHHMLEAADVVARGAWCVVRRDRANGRVLRYALHQGTRLEVAGKRLVGPRCGFAL